VHRIACHDSGDGGRAHAGVTLEERKMPMRFSWVACQPNCRGWVSAVGIVTADTPRISKSSARTPTRRRNHRTGFQRRLGQRLHTLGRRWRNLGALTTVGNSTQTRTAQGDRASVAPEAYCESMCVFSAAVGQDALRARGRACQGTSDLDG